MTISELFRDIKHETYGDGSIRIKDIKYDSRMVNKGDLFFCITGYHTDGHAYARQAVEAGAVAVVVTEYQEGLSAVQIKVEDGRAVMALVAAKFFGYPARKMKMVGITGTNGKTTTTYMIKQIAEKAGKKVGLIGTIVNMIGDEAIHTEHTTPESIDLQKLLKEMVDKGCDMAVMEVSSHSLTLKRVYGIEFDVGVFTNLTQDHLDFHKSWIEYVNAKSLMFEHCRISVINEDDDSAANMIAAASNEVMRFAVKQPTQYTAKNVRLSEHGVEYDVELGNKPVHIKLNIPGTFTVYNSLGAALAAYALNLETYFIEQGLREMKSVAGRFELLDTRGQGYTIILDYAHTPDGLENTLEAIREFAPARVISVFGCGGNRDAGKRPQMGEIAARLSDFVIITSDNPRFEEPKLIIEQIENGLKDKGAAYICIENRRAAIKYAMEHAQKRDIILLAGKGHEDYQEIKGVKHSFDEKQVVAELFDELGIKRRNQEGMQ